MESLATFKIKPARFTIISRTVDGITHTSGTIDFEELTAGSETPTYRLLMASTSVGDKIYIYHSHGTMILKRTANDLTIEDCI